MVCQSFLLFCFLLGIAFECHAQTQNQIYECYAYTDPHVRTWRSKGSAFTIQNYQDCYRGGFYRVVKNDFIDFQADTRNKWMVEIQMFLYDGTSPIPVCFIYFKQYEPALDVADKCRSYGITWQLARSTAGYQFTLSHARANFTTTIQHDYASRTYAPHFNIYAWQPQSLVTKSTGICKLRDPDCSVTARADELTSDDALSLPQQRTISSSQAKTICEANVNAYLTKTRRSPYQRSLNTNNTIANVLSSCEADLTLTGFYQAAKSSVGVLVMNEITEGLSSIDSIRSAVVSDAPEAFAALDDAAKEVEVDVLEILGLPTPTPTTTTTLTTMSTTLETTTKAATTTSAPRAGFKCSVYQNMYIQTWHPTNEATPPSRTCSSTGVSVELVRNKHVRYTLNTAGSSIGELTLILFDGMSPNAVCTVTVVNADPQWMDCEKHGISPSVTTTATHKELVVYYARANFTTVVKQDIGINIGRFNIDIYQNPDLALQSTGACNLISSCSGGSSGQSKRIR